MSCLNLVLSVRSEVLKMRKTLQTLDSQLGKLDDLLH